ncbi:MAG TPA: hypothetical protein VFV87_05630 [Pirellulaceae bacterium]|nr:hypothetical protein [Pirellulaceae bacterium]
MNFVSRCLKIGRMRLAFQFRIWDALALLTLAALALALLTNANEFLAHTVATSEVLLVIAAITFIPVSAGPTQRFLIAFVASAVAYQLFESNDLFAPFRVIVEQVWLNYITTENPRPAGVYYGALSGKELAFFDIAHSLIGLALASTSGIVAKAIRSQKVAVKE